MAGVPVLGLRVLSGAPCTPRTWSRDPSTCCTRGTGCPAGCSPVAASATSGAGSCATGSACSPGTTGGTRRSSGRPAPPSPPMPRRHRRRRDTQCVTDLPPRATVRLMREPRMLSDQELDAVPQQPQRTDGPKVAPVQPRLHVQVHERVQARRVQLRRQLLTRSSHEPSLQAGPGVSDTRSCDDAARHRRGRPSRLRGGWLDRPRSRTPSGPAHAPSRTCAGTAWSQEARREDLPQVTLTPTRDCGV